MRISAIAAIAEELIIQGERNRRIIFSKTLTKGMGHINPKLLNEVLLDHIMHEMYFEYGPWED